MSNLLEASKALLDLDAANAIVPHGLGGHGRECLTWCVGEIERLRTVDSVVEEAIGNAVSRAVAAERAACIQIVESCGASYGGFSNVAIEAAVRAIAERAACATKEITLDESVLPKTCPACGAVCIAHDLETELENEGADYDCELGASAVTKA